MTAETELSSTLLLHLESETAWIRLWLAAQKLQALLRKANFDPNHDYYPYIDAYLDEPKSLAELQASVSKPAKGYDIHHIVEKAPARSDGYPESMIEGSENLVRIPTLKHWEVNAWYMRKDPRFGGLSPREYLKGKGWEERRHVGEQALREIGILK